MKKLSKAVFLLLLSLYSVFFAEIIAGSSNYPLFDLWGLFVVIPLYGFHVIILLTIIIRFQKGKVIPFRTMYFAGMLFALYEAYITKVLWIGFSDDPHIFLGIGLIEYLILVPFWHPIFSFIIPSALLERTLLKSSYIFDGLPNFMKHILNRKAGIISLFAIIGVFAAINGTFPILLLSMISMLVPMLLVIYLLKRRHLTNEYTLKDIMPRKQTFIIMCILLLGLYVFGTLWIRFDAITLMNQIPIWISYLIFGPLFILSLSKEYDKVEQTDHPPISYQQLLWYSVLMITSSSLITIVLPNERFYSMKILFGAIVWVLLGCLIFIFSLISLCKKANSKYDVTEDW